VVHGRRRLVVHWRRGLVVHVLRLLVAVRLLVSVRLLVTVRLLVGLLVGVHGLLIVVREMGRVGSIDGGLVHGRPWGRG
jgi:hypothetical protein